MGFFLVKHGMTLGGVSLTLSFLVLALFSHDFDIVYDFEHGNAELEQLSQVYLSIYTLEGLMMFRYVVFTMFGSSIALLVISYRQRKHVYA